MLRKYISSYPSLSISHAATPIVLYADFFEDITNQIVDNPKRLSYGVSVTDVNQDGNFDFVVTGFGYLNLALSYEDGKLINIVKQKKIYRWV